jgi:Ca2+-binding RTX toxin-like protein
VRGSDLLLGGWADDELWGGPGNDRVFGGPGNDDIHGYDRSATGSNYDTVHGEGGNDRFFGGYGERYGDGGGDYLSAGHGNSRFFGGPGNDQLNAGSFVSKDVGFTQVANGGPGEDRFAVSVFLGPLGSKQPPDDITYLADDGEHDTITCWNVKKETVRADPLDTFPTNVFGPWKAGRKYCDFVRIVR